jgi:hypothetical protein
MNNITKNDMLVRFQNKEEISKEIIIRNFVCEYTNLIISHSGATDNFIKLSIPNSKYVFKYRDEICARLRDTFQDLTVTFNFDTGDVTFFDITFDWNN